MDLQGGCVGGQPANNNVTPTCAIPVFTGDFNGDQIINLSDYQIFRGRWNYPNMGQGQALLAAPPEGDANGDGLVNILDYNIWLADYNATNPVIPAPPAPTMVGDLNFDNVIDIQDFNIWLSSLNQTGPGLFADGDVDETIDYGDLVMWATHLPSGIIAGDFNNDAIVDLWDYNVLKQNWNQSAPNLPSDITGDGTVNTADYTVWFHVYNQVNAPSQPSFSGDCDGDGIVDGSDFLKWQRLFGQTGPALACDFNADGIIDGADLNLWKSSFGN